MSSHRSENPAKSIFPVCFVCLPAKAYQGKPQPVTRAFHSDPASRLVPAGQPFRLRLFDVERGFQMPVGVLTC